MYSKGISWIDDCRIPFVDENEKWNYPNGAGGNTFHGQDRLDMSVKANTQGRFPANLLVSDDMLNDGVISKSVSGGKGKALPNSDGKNDGIRMRPETVKERGGFNDKGTNSRYYDIDKWFDNLIDV
jgi:hypothetical protein